MGKMEKPKKPQLTDDERHARFKEMGKELDADESPEAFDRAFASIVPTPKPKS